jgi:integrase/recombinase XerC
MAKTIAGPLCAATAADLMAWRRGLTITDDAVIHYVSHAREFYRWLVREGRRNDNPAEDLPVPKQRKRLPRPIGDEDLAYAVATAGERVRPWLILAAWCGLRAKEIALLKWESVLDTAEPPLILVATDATKGTRERAVPLHPFAAQELASLTGRRSGYVFRRHDGRPGHNQPWLVSMLANEHLHACGSPATLHQLRHWFGTNTYRAKRDLRVVQELMGHESPNTTAGYAAFDRAEAVDAVNALPVPTALRPVRKLKRQAELPACYSKPWCTPVRTHLVTGVRHPVRRLARHMCIVPEGDIGDLRPERPLQTPDAAAVHPGRPAARTRLAVAAAAPAAVRPAARAAAEEAAPGAEHLPCHRGRLRPADHHRRHRRQRRQQLAVRILGRGPGRHRPAGQGRGRAEGGRSGHRRPGRQVPVHHHLGQPGQVSRGHCRRPR